MSKKTETYKRLGDYIRQVDVRNKDLKVERLLGISVSKEFIPSIANTIGTNMSTYKVVHEGQFVYIADTSRRGDKIAVALLDGEDAIVSSIYTVFEITDTERLCPEYLMMWFRRPEFDRYARFHSHGSAREIFDWEEMCDVMFPVPSIDRQREIVAQHESLTRRIHINEQLIARLEDTAQALYRKMFVDGIDKEHLPEGWRMGTLGEVADFCYGKLPNKKADGNIPVFSGYAVVGYTNDEMYDEQHIVVIARGDSGSGRIVLSPNKFFLTNLAIAVLLKEKAIKNYLYYHLLSLDTSSLRSGSAQAQVTVNSLVPFEILLPPTALMQDFGVAIDKIISNQQLLRSENAKLSELQSLLLTRMTQY